MMQHQHNGLDRGNEKRSMCKLSQQAKVFVAKYASEHVMAAARQIHNNNHVVELIIDCVLKNLLPLKVYLWKVS